MDITDSRFDKLPAAGKLRFVNDGGIVRLLDSNGKRYRMRPEPGTPVHAVAATATLTGTTIGNNNIVDIGDNEYVFVTALTDPPASNEVLIGASDSDSLDNLIAGINGEAGEGTLYGEGMIAHPDVTAAAGDGDTMVVTARVAGISGNSIPVSEDLTSGAWSSDFLTGGVNATEAQAGDQLYDGSFLYTAVADVSKTSASGWEKSATAAL